MLSKEKKEKIIAEYGKKPGDTGSPEVQIALLTERINELTEHLKVNQKDQKRTFENGRPEKGIIGIP